MFGRPLAVSALSLALLGAAGCSSDKAPAPAPVAESPDGAGGDAASLVGEVSCVDDPRVDTYVANIQKEGESGFVFTLTASDPAPPAKGGNTFTLSITDSSGEPVSGDLTADLKMPDHGHSTQVKPVITFDSETGLYTLDPMYLFMAGVWRIQFEVYETGSDHTAPLDSAVFFFCIEG